MQYNACVLAVYFTVITARGSNYELYKLIHRLTGKVVSQKHMLIVIILYVMGQYETKYHHGKSNIKYSHEIQHSNYHTTHIYTYTTVIETCEYLVPDLKQKSGCNDVS